MKVQITEILQAHFLYNEINKYNFVKLYFTYFPPTKHYCDSNV